MKRKQIILEECKCLSSSCMYNIDFNCTKKPDNITPSFMFDGLCHSKVTLEDIKT